MKYIYIITFIFFGQFTFAQNNEISDNQIETIQIFDTVKFIPKRTYSSLNMCVDYMQEGRKENIISNSEIVYNDFNNQIDTMINECFYYMLERRKELGRRINLPNISDSIFILQNEWLKFLYSGNDKRIIHQKKLNKKIVFVNDFKYAKEKNMNPVHVLGSIELVDNNFIIYFAAYRMVEKIRKNYNVYVIEKKIDKETLKRIYWQRDFVGSYSFYFQYCEQNNKWEMVDVKIQ